MRQMVRRGLALVGETQRRASGRCPCYGIGQACYAGLRLAFVVTPGNPYGTAVINLGLAHALNSIP